MLRVIGLVCLAVCFPALAQATDYCTGDDFATCYAFIPYLHTDGNYYCRRFPDNDPENIFYPANAHWGGISGVTYPEDISVEDLRTVTEAAVQRWRQAESRLPSPLLDAWQDSLENSSVAFRLVDELPPGFNPNAHGGTIHELNGDGTICHARMYLNIRPDYIWQICTIAECDWDNGIADLPGTVTHELGHWWGLNHVYNAACFAQPGYTEPNSDVTMYGYNSRNSTWLRTPEAPDKEGVRVLYGETTLIQGSLTATGLASTVRLNWEVSEAGTPSGGGFEISRATMCAGPYVPIATIARLDPTYTQDGGFNYTFYDNGVTQSRTYWYKVVDVYEHNEDLASASPTALPSVTTPAPPTGVLASIDYGVGLASVAVTWSAVQGSGIHYRVYSDPHPGS